MKNNLKQILDYHGLSQVQLSTASNVAVGTVNKACNMRYDPATKTKRRLVIGLCALTGKKISIKEIFPLLKD